MFQRQLFGSANPFQPWPGVNPFFQQAAGVNPFFQQLVGSNPLLSLYGGINPLQQIAGQISPFHQFAGQAPFNPLLGMNPLINQITGAQQPGLNPAFGIPAFGANPLGIPTGPYGVQAGPIGHPGIHGGGYGIGPVNPYAGQFGQPGAFNPLSVDPTAALMLAQQSSPVSQYFPIRPLLGQNPLEQFQGVPGGHIPGPVIDPYSALINAQAQALSQLAANPLLQHWMRAQVSSQ